MIGNMRTLVIGGIQFMGREIVRRLLDRGDEVSVMHRRDHHDFGPHVRNLQADRADLDRVAKLLRETPVDAVFDMVYDFEKGTPAEHVEATARMCGGRLQRYVFMSTLAVYGGGLDRRESDPIAPDDFPDPYVQHKASSERALFRMHAESGFPVTTIRPPFVHGPRQPFYREQFFWDRMLDGRPVIVPDSGEKPMPWAFAPDVAEACVRALEVPEAAGEAFNVGHVEKTTQRTFVEALARVAGVEPKLAFIPREKILAAGGNPLLAANGNLYFGEYLELPPMTGIIEKAPRLLGVTLTPLDEALRLSFEWYRTQPQRPVDYGFEDRLLGVRP
jgi:2'-hydroxyisoflavone reductase